MKKINITVLLLCAALSANAQKVELKNAMDSLSYAAGASQLPMVDKDCIPDYMKGLEEGMKLGNDKNRLAYCMGIIYGHQISNNEFISAMSKQIFVEDSTLTINKDLFIKGFVDATTGKSQMSLEKALSVKNEKAEKVQEKMALLTYGDYKRENELFLENNAKQKGVVVLPSGLQYKVLRMGKGSKPKKLDRVNMLYKLTTIKGSVIESCEDISQPAACIPDKTIRGLREALLQMPLGSKWIIYVPSKLAYKAESYKGIKPFSTLIYELEVLE